jgi:signal transduction histidine kinase
MTLSRRLLIHVALGSALVIAGVAAVTYGMVHQESERLVIERLDTYVAERTRREESVFRQVHLNLETVRSLYLSRNEQPIPADIQARWDALIRHDPDGGWRSHRERADPSLWGHRDLPITPLNQHRLLNALEVCADLMPAWEEKFPSVYLSFAGSACVGFNNQQVDWVWETPSDFQLENQDWYLDATPEKNPGRGFVWTGIYPDPTSALPFATVILPIYDRKGEFICTLAHDMHLDILVSEVTRSDFPGATHFIVRTDGRLIAHPELRDAIINTNGTLTVQEAGDPALIALFQTVTATNAGRVSGLDPMADTYYSAYRLDLPTADWIFVTQLPRSEVRARALRSAQWVWWSGLAMLGLLVGSFAGILRRQVSRPLAELTRATEAMATGVEPPQTPSIRGDELGTLAASFQQMVSRVAEREGDLRQLNAELEHRVADRTDELARALERERELGAIKSDFVSLVSHEFRTPLGVIMSATDVLRRYFDRLPAEKRERHLGMIFNSTRNLAALIEEVLLLGSVEDGRMTFSPEPMDLEAFCRSLADELYSATGGVCPIRFTAASALCGAVGDDALLRHILINLLSNACKYSDPGSPVVFTAERAGDLARFVVSDRGIGIPEPDRARLFTSFTRGSNVGSRPGTGLGLVLVQRCVRLHGGSLGLESAPGVGTTVTVLLPLFTIQSPTEP